MIKRFILINIIFCLVIGNLCAQTISQEEAKVRAEKFAKEIGATISSTNLTRGNNAIDDLKTCYNFEINNGLGFILVNAEMNTEIPILGYSNNTMLNIDEMPDVVRTILNNYLEGPDKISSKNNAFEAYGAYPAVEPICKTTWQQGAPYNQQCPEIVYDPEWIDHYAAGSFAVATAQTMVAHKHPASYKWDILHPVHDENTSAEDNAEVARLIHEVGEKIGTVYGTSGTQAEITNVRKALIEDFGYSPSIVCRYKTGCSVASLDAMVYEELHRGRPVIYRAENGSKWQAFVVDGMDVKGFFHVNWGWGGVSDGYYHPALLDPSIQGVGDSSSAYINDIKFLTGVRPAKEGDVSVDNFLLREMKSDDGYSFDIGTH